MRQRIYHGVWGTAPFQAAHPPAASLTLWLLSMPEWYLVIAMLALLSAGGLIWTPLLLASPLLALAVAARIAEAGIAAARAPVMWRTKSRDRLGRWLVTSFLHLSALRSPPPRADAMALSRGGANTTAARLVDGGLVGALA